jgi:hypothetical protein
MAALSLQRPVDRRATDAECLGDFGWAHAVSFEQLHLSGIDRYWTALVDAGSLCLRDIFHLPLFAHPTSMSPGSLASATLSGRRGANSSGRPSCRAPLPHIPMQCQAIEPGRCPRADREERDAMPSCELGPRGRRHGRHRHVEPGVFDALAVRGTNPRPPVRSNRKPPASLHAFPLQSGGHQSLRGRPFGKRWAGHRSGRIEPSGPWQPQR